MSDQATSRGPIDLLVSPDVSALLILAGAVEVCSRPEFSIDAIHRYLQALSPNQRALREGTMPAQIAPALAYAELLIKERLVDVVKKYVGHDDGRVVDQIIELAKGASPALKEK